MQNYFIYDYVIAEIMIEFVNGRAAEIELINCSVAEYCNLHFEEFNEFCEMQYGISVRK